jgi:CubicO group peptidase (beta-lactamase class C family)
MKTSGNPSRRTVLLGAACMAGTTALSACGLGPRRSDSDSSGDPDTTTIPGPTTVQEAGYVPGADDAWERVEPESAGWTTAGLTQVSELARQSNSRTLVMLSGGRILLEEYYGADAGYSQDIASCQKSVTSTLLGMAQQKGMLQIDQPVSNHLPAGWSKAPPADEASITVRHLMTMSSGLHPRTLRMDAEPGTTFVYNTAAYQKLRLVLEAVTDQDINTVSRAWMFDPIGVGPTATWAPRGAGRSSDGEDADWGLVLTAREMTRFGLLSARQGRWDDRDLLDGSWYAEAWSSSPTQPDYGLLWWLLGKSRRGGPDAPADWVAALGAGDQKIYVVPSLDLVVARQGGPAGEAGDSTSSWDAQLMRTILAARA